MDDVTQFIPEHDTTSYFFYDDLRRTIATEHSVSTTSSSATDADAAASSEEEEATRTQSYYSSSLSSEEEDGDIFFHDTNRSYPVRLEAAAAAITKTLVVASSPGGGGGGKTQYTIQWTRQNGSSVIDVEGNAIVVDDDVTVDYGNDDEGHSDIRTEGESTAASRSGSSFSYRLCHIPILQPFTDGEGDVSTVLQDSARGALLAVYHLNNRIETVVSDLKSKLGDKCNIRFTVDFYDTERSPKHSGRLLSKYVQPRGFPYEATAVVGAARSAVSAPLAILNSVWSIPQISHASTSTSLDSRDTYQYFGRVIPSNDGDANAAVDYMSNVQGVSHFAILYVHDEYGTAYRHSLQTAAKKAGLVTSAHGYRFYQDEAGRVNAQDRIVDAVKQIKETKYRYVVALIFQSHLEEVLEQANKAGIIGPGYFWLLGDGVSVNDFSGGVVKYPVGSPLIDATHGLGVIMTGVQMIGKQYDGFMREWSDLDENDDFRNYFESKQPLHTDKVQFKSDHTFAKTITQWPLLMYDAVISLGIAACNSKDTFFTGKSLFDNFIQAKFDGATGRVEIDPRTKSRDYKTAVYSISNIIANLPEEDDGNVTFRVDVSAEYHSHVLDGKATTAQWVVKRPYNYSDYTFNHPSSLPPLDEDMNLIGWPVKGVGLGLGAFVMFSSIYFAIWTYCHRNKRVVQASQPMFLILICGGVLIMGAASIPLSLQESPPYDPVVGCMAGYWLFFVGAALAFAALSSKLWRLNKIMHNRQFRRIVISSVDVTNQLILLLSVNVSLLTAWQIISPLKYQRSYSTSVDEFGRHVYSTGFCETQKGNINSFVFEALLFLGSGILLLIANIQAYRARHIATEYSESRYIAITMALLLQNLMIGIPVLVSASRSPRLNYLAKVLLIFLACGEMLFLIFIPKVTHLRQHIERKSRHLEAREQRARASIEAILDHDRRESALDTVESPVGLGIVSYSEEGERTEDDCRIQWMPREDSEVT